MATRFDSPKRMRWARQCVSMRVNVLNVLNEETGKLRAPSTSARFPCGSLLPIEYPFVEWSVPGLE